MKQVKVCVTGAAGFVAGHLCRYLREHGYFVRAVDHVEPRYGDVDCDEAAWSWDLRHAPDATQAVDGMDWVFNLAADMGGAGFVFTGDNDREILRNNTLINVNMLHSAYLADVKRYLFSSSACVYPAHLQTDWHQFSGLKETDAYPADPDSAYGQEKLYTECLCHAYNASTPMDVKIVRFHNCYGERGAWTGGREKAPAALCRKVATVKLTGNPEVEIWGDGTQMRSYMYIGDCVQGLLRLMQSDCAGPLNMGRDRCVSVDQLVDAIADIAGVDVVKKHIPGPTGVAWRNSDNALCAETLGWVPETPIEVGLIPTYGWIENRVKESLT